MHLVGFIIRINFVLDMYSTLHCMRAEDIFCPLLQTIIDELCRVKLLRSDNQRLSVRVVLSMDYI